MEVRVEPAAEAPTVGILFLALLLRQAAEVVGGVILDLNKVLMVVLEGVLAIFLVLPMVVQVILRLQIHPKVVTAGMDLKMVLVEAAAERVL